MPSLAQPIPVMHFLFFIQFYLVYYIFFSHLIYCSLLDSLASYPSFLWTFNIKIQQWLHYHLLFLFFLSVHIIFVISNVNFNFKCQMHFSHTSLSKPQMYTSDLVINLLDYLIHFLKLSCPKAKSWFFKITLPVVFPTSFISISILLVI